MVQISSGDSLQGNYLPTQWGTPHIAFLGYADLCVWVSTTYTCELRVYGFSDATQCASERYAAR